MSDIITDAAIETSREAMQYVNQVPHTIGRTDARYVIECALPHLEDVIRERIFDQLIASATEDMQAVVADWLSAEKEQGR